MVLPDLHKRMRATAVEEKTAEEDVEVVVDVAAEAVEAAVMDTVVEEARAVADLQEPKMRSSSRRELKILPKNLMRLNPRTKDNSRKNSKKSSANRKSGLRFD